MTSESDDDELVCPDEDRVCMRPATVYDAISIVCEDLGFEEHVLARSVASAGGARRPRC